MSCIFCIGFDGGKPEMKISGFSEHCSDDYGNEALAKAKKLESGVAWMIATSRDSSSDLDISHEIPASLKSGKLRKILDNIGSDADRVLILILDLGTSRETHHPRLAFSSIEQILSEWYALGAPDETVFLEFVVRNGGVS